MHIFHVSSRAINQSLHNLQSRCISGAHFNTVTGADGRTRSFFLTLNPHSTVKKMLQDDPNAAIGNDCIDYNSVDDCGNPSISQYTYSQGLRRFEVENVIDGQLIAQFLTDASNGVLRSGATATTPRVSMSYFIDAQTAPPLPGVADLGLDLSLQRVFPHVMECLGTTTNTATFVGLERSIHQAKTLVSALSWRSTAPQFRHVRH